MLEETREALETEIIEGKRSKLSTFVQEIIELSESHGYTLPEFIDAIACCTSNRAQKENSEALRLATGFLEKAVESAKSPL